MARNPHDIMASGLPRWLTRTRERQLGQVPDSDIADAAGVSRSTVARWRRKLRIPGWCPRAALF